MDRFMLNMLGFLISVKFAINIDVLLKLNFGNLVMQSAAPSEYTLKPTSRISRNQV